MFHNYIFSLTRFTFYNTSGKKFISINFIPPPLQVSHLPPETLKENRPALYPLIWDSGKEAYNCLMSSKTLVYVADWSEEFFQLAFDQFQ